MPKPMDDKEVRKYLEAFADGELDVEQNLRVLEHMSMNPQATRRAMHQQQLRQAVERAMKECSPAAPSDLRAKIEAIASQANDDDAVTLKQMRAAKHDRGILAVLRRWTPAIAAAVILVVTASIWFQMRQDAAQPGLPVYQVDARTAGRIDRRHETCAAALDRLSKAHDFGKEVGILPEKVKEFLAMNEGVPVLDLSSIGYEYAGAGQCGAAGGKSVHVVYRGKDKPPISLWIRADSEGEVTIDEGKVYVATPADIAHPILIWRRNTTVFYLTGMPVKELMTPAWELATAR
ncbi:MAG: hypothetical protein WD768_07850 [Phycisphaeraceae bacterium]